MTAVCDGAGDGDSTAGGVAVCATAVADGVTGCDGSTVLSIFSDIFSIPFTVFLLLSAGN